jgi:hypothetical protein
VVRPKLPGRLRPQNLIALADRFGLPIIGMSGYPGEIRNLEESKRPHLIKPFGVTAVLATIESVVNAGQPEAASVLVREVCPAQTVLSSATCSIFAVICLTRAVVASSFSADIIAETQEVAIQHASDILRTTTTPRRRSASLLSNSCRRFEPSPRAIILCRLRHFLSQSCGRKRIL